MPTMLVVMVADCTYYKRKLEAMLAFSASQAVRVWVCEQTCPMRMLNLSAVAQKKTGTLENYCWPWKW